MSNYQLKIYDVINGDNDTLSLTAISSLYLSSNELRTISKSLAVVSTSEINISIYIKGLFAESIESEYLLFDIHKVVNQSNDNNNNIPFTQLLLLCELPSDNDIDKKTINMLFEDKIDDRDNFISYDINNLSRFFGSLPYYPNSKTSFDVCVRRGDLLRFELTNIDS